MYKTNNSIYFYFSVLLLFFIDVSVFFSTTHVWLYGLLGLYTLTLFNQMNITRLIIIAFLLSLESFLFFGTFGIQLAYLIPLSIVAVHLKDLIFTNRFYPYLFLAILIALQTFILEHFWLGLRVPIGYTNMKIIANIIVTWLMSLKFYTQDNPGNRL